ncbi:beta family protein [Azospirillum doebereinerae]
MKAFSPTLYSPALRMKTGELIGLRELAPDIAGRALPRMIVPPPEERDDELQAKLFASEVCPDISHALATCWPNRDVLVEATYLLNEFGRDKMSLWLPRMFDMARKAGAKAIPLVTLGDLLSGDVESYKDTIAADNALKFGLVVSSANLSDLELIKQALGAMERLNLMPEQCAIIADFHDAEFSQPAIVAPIIDGVLSTLQSMAHWQRIIFQGTNYPEKNPADADSCYLVPRNEWIAWRQAVRFDPHTADHMIFGDYAADCAKIAFGGGGGKAIRHYRYTTDENWLVQRGKNEGKDQENMHLVCKNILTSGMFEGREFSWADEFIYRTAKMAGGPGNSTYWRAVNTAHHITKIVTDIGDMKGIKFSKKTVAPLEEQIELFA